MAAILGALSNMRSQSSCLAASTACTCATGFPTSRASRTPSCAARSTNPAASVAGSPASSCQTSPNLSKCRCAYSIAALVFPDPPRPHSAATRGRRLLPAERYPCRSESSSSRPAKNDGRSGSRTGRLWTAGRWYSIRPTAVPPHPATTEPFAAIQLSPSPGLASGSLAPDR